MNVVSADSGMKRGCSLFRTRLLTSTENGTIGVTERCLAASHDEHLLSRASALCIHYLEEMLHSLRLKLFRFRTHISPPSCGLPDG